ncbi:MAG: heavy metal-responsive transcriptional regulator [Thermovirgaceae bacterium]|nr:heavy metal-responsive transcriptional regulator [Thermovirgaceae bacterium]
MTGLTISRLARMAEVSIDTIRFYEGRGLIAPPPRTDSNYRMYPEGDAARLRFIKRAKELGFSLCEIKDLLALQHDSRASKSDVKLRTEEKARSIRQKIRDLTQILETLEHLVAACDGHGPVSECPIIEALSFSDETEPLHHHNHVKGGTNHG